VTGGSGGGTGGGVSGNAGGGASGGTRAQALSGRPIDEITLDGAVRGDLAPTDLRVHPDTLRRQAAVAEAHGNPQLGENLRRAAELTALPDDDVLAIYESLRPGRSTRAGLAEIAARLEAEDAPLCAALVREAAEVYACRGLLKPA
jgi:propanediol dehydratase small subunit